jgi:nicotinamidase-related amidase
MSNVGKNPDLHGAVPEHADTALLILDLISDYEFDGGEVIARRVLPIARRIARLKQRARRAGVPTIYVNDDMGRWRSDFPALVRRCMREGSRGASIVRLIAPDARDYCLLKPKHSGFYATALATVLEYMAATRLILTGTTSHQCVLFTANDAHVRDFELMIPRDCICAASRADTQFALRYFDTVLGADTRTAAAIARTLSPSGLGARARRSSVRNAHSSKSARRPPSRVR